MKSGKTRLVGCPLLSRLRRRFAPLRGTQRRYAALFFAPPGRYAPCALRAQPFWKHEKNAKIPVGLQIYRYKIPYEYEVLSPCCTEIRTIRKREGL